jgi:sodium/hydrogen exchanger 8
MELTSIRLLQESFEDVLVDVEVVGQDGVIHDAAESSEGDVSTEILIVVFLLILASAGGQALRKSGHKYLQEAGLTVLIGMAAGLFFKLTGVTYFLTALTEHFSGLFVLLLLPPIIFESGYNMNKKYFLKNSGTILVYSFLGTFIAMFSSSFMFWCCGQIGFSQAFTWKEAFAFGALISATDPVSVLACFKEMDADVHLNAIIFGESIFNDAIAIVMYNIVMNVGEGDTSVGTDIFKGIGDFFLIFIGSLFMGSIFALMIAFVLKRSSNSILDDQLDEDLSYRQKVLLAKSGALTEISMMILAPLVAYFVAGGMQLSGIVAILLNGIFLNYYAKPNITPAARKITKMLYEVIAHGAETIVFLFLGIGLFTIETPFKVMGWGTLVCTIINLNVARFLNIWVCTFLANRQRSENSKLNLKTQFVMWFGGLRGAMAYALALEASVTFGSPVGPCILVTTLVYSLITVLGLGSVLHPVLNWADVKRKKEEESHSETDNTSNRLKKNLSYFDTEYFAPLFIKDTETVLNRNQGRTESFAVSDTLASEIRERVQFLQDKGYTSTKQDSNPSPKSGATLELDQLSPSPAAEGDGIEEAK